MTCCYSLPFGLSMQYFHYYITHYIQPLGDLLFILPFLISLKFNLSPQSTFPNQLCFHFLFQKIYFLSFIFLKTLVLVILSFQLIFNTSLSTFQRLPCSFCQFVSLFKFQLHAVLFLSRPQSEGWPHHERRFSIYLFPLSRLTLPWKSCPHIDVVHPSRARPSSPACTWHCSLQYLLTKRVITCCFLLQ